MTATELQNRQQWTLAQKIDHSLGVIEAFSSYFDGKVFVSYSGGKDSVVMSDLVRFVLPNVKHVFVMTGCESPSVCRFIRSRQFEIEIIKPAKTLQQVFADCGFPLVSKEVSHAVLQIKRNPHCITSQRMLQNVNRRGLPERWRYLLNEPYQVSDRCCFWLKKKPLTDYMKQTGLRPYIGLTAAESHLRTTAYINRGGCNSFGEQGKQHAASWPLAIWTEQDVLAYINDRHLELPDIYKHGAMRTGCMGCGFGAHIHGESLDVMQRLWPKWYDMVMDYENNGHRYGDALARMIAEGKHFKKVNNGNNNNIQTTETR